MNFKRSEGIPYPTNHKGSGLAVDSSLLKKRTDLHGRIKL